MATKDEIKILDSLWIQGIGNGEYKVGLTAETQEELGNVTFVMLPKVGQVLSKGDSFAEVEAEKAVSEFSSPIAGKIAKINEQAVDTPSILDDKDSLNAWLVIFSDVEEENN